MAPKLLIVEDSTTISKVIERLGLSLGYQTTIAKSFAQVKAILANNPTFFAATIDLSLPDAPNGEVIPYVLERKIPSIVMTGRMDDVTRKKILNLPVIDYITKENTQAYHYLLRVLNSQLTNKNISVLVVDDSLTSRNHTAQLLKRRNFTVYVAPDGTKALQILEDKPEIKIVVTDHEMPGMSGIELLQKIRKTYSPNELVVIGFSGSKKDTHSARFIKNGADDFLKKPLCPEEFYSRIMQHIDKLQFLEKINLAANQDYLTNLLNHRSFISQVTEAMEFSLDDSTSNILAIINVDNFKNINEKLGSETGDRALVEFAKTMKKQFPDQISARLSADEFAIYLNVGSVDECKAQLSTLQLKVSQLKIKAKDTETSFTVSIGGASMDSEQSIEAMLNIAKNALAHGRSDGKQSLFFQT